MKQLRLTNSKLVALIDDEDFELCNRLNWQNNPKGAVETQINKNTVTLANFIMDFHGTHIKMIDHQDLNYLNNQKSNFRIATKSQNGINRRKFQGFHSSEYKGVYWNKNLKKWHARICVNWKRIHLGFYFQEKEAAEAYNTAAKKYFGRFAALNET